jgi:hypothetical protein
MEIMQRAGLEEVIGSQDFYTSVHDGVDAFLAEGQNVSGSETETT